ncbi:MAG: hypothetical protein Q4E53_14035 [Eubacteriales bacterium]|nr:hypothetical protein [Eubacteriales bacterium]
MKLKELLKMMIETQQVKIVNKKKDDLSIYEGIKAGCIGDFCSSEVVKIYGKDDVIVAEVEYELPTVFTASDEDLYDMFFDEDEADFDIAELEKKMFSLQEDMFKGDMPKEDSFKENLFKGDLKDILSDFDF